MPVSSEFVEICDAQVDVLADGLGASLCIVYLTEPSSEQETGALIPVVVYPEDLTAWAQSELLSWLGHVDGFGYPAIPLPRLTQNGHPEEVRTSNTLQPVQWDRNDESLDDVDKSSNLGDSKVPRQGAGPIAPLLSDTPQPEQHKIALPLMYGDLVVGLLVTARPDRIWTDQEHHQIEQIAKTISIACVMDQRSQWLESTLQQSSQKILQTHQHDVFDDLIHQFRNPLTALRTFGKLLVRRLQPGDRNFGVAESIVRESDRLQDLLQQFKIALDLETGEDQEWATEPTLRLLSGTPSAGEIPTQPVKRPNDEHRVPPVLPPEPTAPPVIDVSSSATYLTGHDISTVPCDLSAVLASVLDVAQAIAQDYGIRFQVDVAPSLSLVMADAKGLQEVLMNLIDNAIKYTPADGQILLRAPVHPGSQQPLLLADTGLGIPIADQEHLFERHFRGVQADGNIPGTGLGLAIARDLLTQMGGQIEVFSPADKTPLIVDWPPLPSQYPGTAFVIWLAKAATRSTP